MIQISFGKKIPIASCTIQDRATKKPIDAMIYEYDCKDSSDFFELYRISKEQEWVFADTICNKADLKHAGKYGDERIISLEDKDGRTVGLCNFRDVLGKTEVKYIDSKSDKKYKYIGQTMLAFLAKLCFFQGKKELRICNASTHAFKFYKKCCFKYDWNEIKKGNNDFYLKRENFLKLVRRNEKKVKAEKIKLFI